MSAAIITAMVTAINEEEKRKVFLDRTAFLGN